MEFKGESQIEPFKRLGNSAVGPVRDVSRRDVNLVINLKIPKRLKGQDRF